MKRFTLLIDGMADRPQQALGGKTPMEAAHTPALDALFAAGCPGTVRTIPPGMEAGSAVANLGLLGYDPQKVYKGRAVIEAAGAGLPVVPGNLYIRCNFVTLSGESFEDSVMESYSAHDIATELSRPLVERLNREVFGGAAVLHPLDTFRNVLVVEGAADIAEKLKFMPPHDMIGQRAGEHIADGESAPYFDMMRRAYEVLRQNNDTKANAVWFWGASYAPDFGAKAAGSRKILAETSLMCGIANLAGIPCEKTDESGGFADFLGKKLQNALAALETADDVYIHIQKLDDLSHELMPKEKAQALEDIDRLFVGPFFAKVQPPYSAAVASDHFTFSDTGSHGAEPAPFVLIGQGSAAQPGGFSEQACRQAGLHVTAGELYALLQKGGDK